MLGFLGHRSWQFCPLELIFHTLEDQSSKKREPIKSNDYDRTMWLIFCMHNAQFSFSQCILQSYAITLQKNSTCIPALRCRSISSATCITGIKQDCGHSFPSNEVHGSEFNKSLLNHIRYLKIDF